MDIKTILKKYLVFVFGLYFLAAGIALNIILPGNDYEFGVNEAGDENRGIHTNSKRKEEK